ncbi:dihydrolipoamide acetyltransferase family protein [Desulforapulum autotrophicum]|uniref:dihydrolipoamide acetyltransferase family protein n=1 Tax=Desulforapulum autotrophicum TaxID=2296 RepID=UPI000316917D|nr:dihydrolipoamide acetyltransferase family protein [Desulforapulum autotrophicum]
MATEILMPKWGLTMKEGKVSKWIKNEGEAVTKGEPLLEVETSKITNNVESPDDGILFQIVVKAGETVPVQTVLAVLAKEGETPDRREAVVRGGDDQPSGDAENTVRDGKKEGKAEFVPATPVARRLAREWGIDLARVPGSGPGNRVTESDVRDFKEKGGDTLPGKTVNAADSALAAAKKAGIDITLVTGSGPDGRITKADVLRAVSPAVQTKTTTASSPGPLVAGTIIPLEGMRRIIGDNMMASLQNAAQLSVFVEFDATRMVSFRDKVRKKYESQSLPRISFNDIIAMVVCRALAKHPLMNSRLTDQGIELCKGVNLGIAVALDNGLVVPNIKSADTLGLVEMAMKIRELAQKAKENKLTMDEIQGGTFTISNVSMLGVDGFTPILNPPETGILGVGRAKDKPAVHQGKIAVRTLMTLSLTFDHRVVDGVPAMQFLRTLADYLEDPVMMMV